MGKIVVSYGWTKINPLIYKGFLVRETGLEASGNDISATKDAEIALFFKGF